MVKVTDMDQSRHWVMISATVRTIFAGMAQISQRKPAAWSSAPSSMVIACSSNLESDRAITVSFETAMQSRWFPLRWWYASVSGYKVTNVALAENYDARIIADPSRHDSEPMDFKLDHTESTFCRPRTWGRREPGSIRQLVPSSWLPVAGDQPS